MPKYLIERTLPGAGRLSPAELRSIAQKSVAVLRELGPDVQWVQSYVLDDKLCCVYIASSTQIIEEHARRGGFPCDRALAVKAIIDPTTAEG